MPPLSPAPHGCGGARGAGRGGERVGPPAPPHRGAAGGPGSRAHFLRTALSSAFPRSRPGRRSLPARARPLPARRTRSRKGGPRGLSGPSPGLTGRFRAGGSPEPAPRSVPHLVYPAASAEPRSPTVPVQRPATAHAPGPRGGGTQPRRGRGRPSYPGRPGAEAGLVGSAGGGTAGSASPLPAAGRCGSCARAARSAVVAARAAAPPPIDMLLTSARTRRGPAPPARRPPPRGPPPRPLRTGWGEGRRERGAAGGGKGLQPAHPCRSLGWQGQLLAPGARGTTRRGPHPLLRRPQRPPALGASWVWGPAGGGAAGSR